MKLIVNHVTSNNVHSGIFEDIFSYFRSYTDGQADHLVSAEPMLSAHIRHYHRPHLEKKLIKPCVVTVHHDLNDPDEWLNIELFIERYKEADCVICLNSLQQQKLAQLGIYHAVVIPHGYNHELIDRARIQSRLKRPKFTIGLISKRYARKVKGEAYLHELAKRLDHERVGFLLVGDGRAEEAHQLRKLNFDVEVYERLPYPVLIDAYRSIDALAMISNFEGGPANIPEAAAMGVPVLANPIGMVPDLIENDRHGIHLKMCPDDDAALIDELAQLDSPRYAQLIISSKTPSDKLISWRESVQRNMCEYVKAIKDNQASLSKAMEAFA